MTTGLISIIIPVFNVEHYLDRCVESVIHQSYRNLEILLIDDGSTDSSGILCDKWAQNDERVSAIHKKNEGVSAARNTGIESSHGEYISFVDSDDYISPDMIYTLYSLMEANDAEISLCGFVFVDENGNNIDNCYETVPITEEILSGRDVINRMISKNGWYYHLAWNKLYKRTVFTDVLFPPGIISGEDAAIAPRLLIQCRKVAITGEKLYFYTQRAESVMHIKSVTAVLHDAMANYDRMLFCKENGFYRSAGYAYWRMGTRLLTAFSRSQEIKSSALEDEFRRIYSDYRKNIRLIKYCDIHEVPVLLAIFISLRLTLLLKAGRANLNVSGK